MSNTNADIADETCLKVIGQPFYQQRALDSWKFIETDAPIALRQKSMQDHIAANTCFWNIHVGLAFLSHRLQPASYLEIGVRIGGSMVQVLANSMVKQVIGIDIWEGEYAGIRNTQEYTGGQIEKFLAGFSINPSISLVHGSSHVHVPELVQEGYKFDLITVDGDHSEEGALLDLRNVLPLLNKGGAIIFDDITHPSHLYLHDVAIQFRKENSHLKLLLNTAQDNGTAILIDDEGLEKVFPQGS